MKRALVIILATIILSALGLSSLSCRTSKETVRVSYAPFETLALLWTANEQGFFARNGLNINLREYDTGAGSLDAVLNAEADVAIGTAEFPVVGRAFKKEKFLVIGSIDQIDFINIVARRDRGIETPLDLKGKKVGTTVGTVAEFFLGRFLELNEMKMQDIELVDVKTPDDWVNAVVEGDIDAIATAQPYADSARDRMGDNAVVWPAQSGHPLYTLAIADYDWTNDHPETVERLLDSLKQAADYVIRSPATAKSIVQKWLNLDTAYMETVWSRNQYGLSLDQSLITAMEDEARWMITNNLTTEKQVPNFLDYIYEKGLRAVKPEAVNIIR